jgi:hypothetical protein
MAKCFGQGSSLVERPDGSRDEPVRTMASLLFYVCSLVVFAPPMKAAAFLLLFLPPFSFTSLIPLEVVNILDIMHGNFGVRLSRLFGLF